MTRPTILDLDLVVVPREASKNADIRFVFGAPVLSIAWPIVSAGSSYPTAWDDVRKYVEGLETEVERLKFLVEWGEAFCDTKHPDTARAEAAEARIAELGADLSRLAETYGDEERPRYTTRRLRLEVERAKAAAGIRIAELEKRLADAERVISKQRDALQPLYDAVFNDNGDITVNLSMPTGEEFIAAYFADRAARAYMEKAAGNPPVGNKDIGERHGDHH